MPPTADELLRRSAHGDLSAFTQFYDTTSGQALLLARAMLTDERSVENAVHDTYVTAWRTAPTYALTSGHGSRGWVLAILRERVRDQAPPA